MPPSLYSGKVELSTLSSHPLLHLVACSPAHVPPIQPQALLDDRLAALGGSHQVGQAGTRAQAPRYQPGPSELPFLSSATQDGSGKNAGGMIFLGRNCKVIPERVLPA